MRCDAKVAIVNLNAAVQIMQSLQARDSPWLGAARVSQLRAQAAINAAATPVIK